MDEACKFFTFPTVILCIVVLIACLMCLALVCECKQEHEEWRRKKAVEERPENGKIKYCTIEKTKMMQTLDNLYDDKENKEKVSRNSSITTV